MANAQQNPQLNRKSFSKEADTAVDLANKEALRKVLAAVILGGSAGVITRGALGLANMPQRRSLPQINSSGPIYASLDPDAIDSNRPGAWIKTPGPQFRRSGQGGASAFSYQPVDDAVNAANKKPQQPQMPKSANVGDTPTPIKTMASNLYDNILKPIGVNKAMDIPVVIGDTTNPSSKWWQFPSMAIGGTAAGYGGWKLTDWLLERQQANSDKDDLAEAEHEYITAMKGLGGGKVAALCEVRKIMLDKKAGTVATPTPAPSIDPIKILPTNAQGRSNLMGAGINVLAGIAALSGIPSAVAVYNYVNGAGDTKALQEAMYQRQRMIQRQQPAPVQFVTPSASALSKDDTDQAAV